MSRLRARLCVAATALAASSAAVALLPAAAGAVPPGWIYAGQKALVGIAIASPNPLRNAPCDSCTVEVWMPDSTGFNPGQGYVTSVIDQPWVQASWCEVNWKGIWGWTGCWRLAPLFG